MTTYALPPAPCAVRPARYARSPAPDALPQADDARGPMTYILRHTPYMPRAGSPVLQRRRAVMAHWVGNTPVLWAGGLAQRTMHGLLTWYVHRCTRASGRTCYCLARVSENKRAKPTTPTLNAGTGKRSTCNTRAVSTAGGRRELVHSQIARPGKCIAPACGGHRPMYRAKHVVACLLAAIADSQRHASAQCGHKLAPTTDLNTKLWPTTSVRGAGKGHSLSRLGASATASPQRVTYYGNRRRLCR